MNDDTETYWNCYICAGPCPEPQVYCSSVCRQVEEIGTP